MAEDKFDTLVSVVIPTYERPEYLRGAIQTALGQTYDNIEVIVVDDGSVEPYADEIVAEYSESVTCIRHEENKGLSAARNTGIRNANGEYVAFLDDDDRWHKTKIARQTSKLNGDEKVGLVTCLVASITLDSELIHCETSAPSGDCSKTILVDNIIGTPSRVLVRRECFSNVGLFDESLPTKQDWDFYLRLCQKWNVAAVEDHLCFRTIHDSMSSSSLAVKRDKNAILEKHEDLIRRNGLWREVRCSVSEIIGGSYLENNELKMARTHLKQALSEFTIKRLLLLLLTYTHPKVVINATKIKRAIGRRLTGCNNLSISSNEIPGLMA